MWHDGVVSHRWLLFRTGSCEDVDSVSVSVPLANGPRVIGIFCGSKRPARLMSNDLSLEVTFKSHETSSASSAKGFSAVYSFVTGQYCSKSASAELCYRKHDRAMRRQT